jgi:hypothetical protein
VGSIPLEGGGKLLLEGEPGVTVDLGQATETDTALAASASKTPALGLAIETDSALTVTLAKLLTLGIAARARTSTHDQHTSSSAPVSASERAPACHRSTLPR